MKYFKIFEKGEVWILLSSLMFGSYGVWSRGMIGVFDDFFQAWTRGALILLILIPIGLFKKMYNEIKRRDIKNFLIISIPGSLTFPLYFYGFANLPIGLATVIFFGTLTVGTFLIGKLFFNENLGVAKLLALFLGFVGLLLIAYDGVLRFSFLPIFAVILAGMCGAIEVVFTKTVSDKYSSVQITTVVYAVLVVVNILLWMGYHFYNGSTLTFPVEVSAWVSQLGHSIASLFAFLFIVIGYKSIEPSVGGLIGLLEIVFGVIFGLFFFNEILSFQVGVGIVLIAIAAAFPNLIELTLKRKSQ